MLKASRVLLAVLAALGMSSSMAQTGPAVGGYTPNTNGKTTGYTYNPNASSDFARLSRGGFTPGAGDSDFRALLLRKGYTPRGSEYPVAVSKPIQKAALAKAIAKTLPVVGNLYAMSELLGELFPNQSPTWNPSQGQWQRTETGYAWCENAIGYNGGLGCTSTPEALCAGIFSNWTSSGSPNQPQWQIYNYNPPDGETAGCRLSQGPYNTYGVYLLQRYPIPPVPRPVTEGDLQTALQTHPTVPPAVDDLLDHIPPAALQQLKQDIAADPRKPVAVPVDSSGNPQTSGVTVPESTSTTTGTNSQGQPITTVTTVQTIARPLPTGEVQHDERTTTTTTTQTGTNPDGSPVTETTTSTTDTVSTPTPAPDTPPGGSTPSENQITCGLPDTPPCKIDESGTPEADPAKTQEEIDSIFGQIKTCLQDIRACLPALPDLSWSFSLPSGCSALQFDTRVGHIVEIDMCEWQPTIHDLMSMLWAAAGLFGAIAMVGRFSAGGA